LKSVIPFDLKACIHLLIHEVQPNDKGIKTMLEEVEILFMQPVLVRVQVKVVFRF